MDAPECSFPQGKVRFGKVAQSHKGMVKTLMLVDRFWCLFPKWHQKVFRNDRVYKVPATAFPHCCQMMFSLGEITFADVVEWHQGIVANLMLLI